MEDLFGVAIFGLFFKETRGYILGFFAFILFVILAIFFPAVAVVLVIVGLLWAVIKIFDSNTIEPLAPTIQNNIDTNKISSVSTENSINVYTDIDNATNTINVIIEDPETKKQTRPIVFEIKNISSDAGVVKEYFQDKNIEIVQIKTASGYEFEVNVKNSSLLELA